MRAVPQTFVLLTYHTFGLTARSPIAEEMQEMETVSALRIDSLSSASSRHSTKKKKLNQH